MTRIEFRGLTVRHTGQIEINRERVVEVEGEVFRKPLNHVYSPGDDITGEDLYVRQLIEQAWTPDVVAAFLTAQPTPPDPEVSL